jgi:hypothetical protein
MKAKKYIDYEVYHNALDFLVQEKFSCHAICAAVGSGCSDHPWERDIYEDLFGLEQRNVCSTKMFDYQDERVIALCLAYEVFKGKTYGYLNPK